MTVVDEILNKFTDSNKQITAILEVHNTILERLVNNASPKPMESVIAASKIGIEIKKKIRESGRGSIPLERLIDSCILKFINEAL